MPRDFADKAMLKRGKHGALTAKLPATGSSIQGGSSLHRTGRRKLNRAIAEGRPILVRASDGVAMRLATFEEVTKSLKSSDGQLTVPDVMSENGSTFGTICVVRRFAEPEQPKQPNYKPRLVRHK